MPMGTTAKDTKLIQYLNEAYGKEKELETALQAHIALASRATYKKRLQQHLQETKRHSRDVERRIKQLGGDGTAELAVTVQSTAARAVALAKGPLHAVRGTGEAERQLKNAKTEYADEAEEIATYTAIEALAESVGDRDTAQLARIRELAIPPAWDDVWVCPYPNGHLQATGVDAAGRKQYRYHDAWRARRDQEKFDAMLEFAAVLPRMRRRVRRDLRGDEMS